MSNSANTQDFKSFLDLFIFLNTIATYFITKIDRDKLSFVELIAKTFTQQMIYFTL